MEALELYHKANIPDKTDLIQRVHSAVVETGLKYLQRDTACLYQKDERQNQKLREGIQKEQDCPDSPVVHV